MRLIAVQERRAGNRAPLARAHSRPLPIALPDAPLHDVPIDRYLPVRLSPGQDQEIAFVPHRKDLGSTRSRRRPHGLRPLRRPPIAINAAAAELVPAFREPGDIRRGVDEFREEAAHSAAVNMPLKLDPIARRPLLLDFERAVRPLVAIPIQVPNAEFGRRIRRRLPLQIHRREHSAELPLRRRAGIDRPHPHFVGGAVREPIDHQSIVVARKVAISDRVVRAVLPGLISVVDMRRAAVGMPPQDDPIRFRRSLQQRRRLTRVRVGLRPNQEADGRVPLAAGRGIAAQRRKVRRIRAESGPRNPVRRPRLDSPSLAAVSEPRVRLLILARRLRMQRGDVFQAFNLRPPAQRDRIMRRFRHQARRIRRRRHGRDRAPSQRFGMFDLPSVAQSRHLRLERRRLGQAPRRVDPAIRVVAPRPVGEIVDGVLPLRLARLAPTHRHLPIRPNRARRAHPERHVEPIVRHLRRLHPRQRERRARQQFDLALAPRAIRVDDAAADTHGDVAEHLAAGTQGRRGALDPRRPRLPFARHAGDLHAVRPAPARRLPVDVRLRPRRAGAAPRAQFQPQGRRPAGRQRSRPHRQLRALALLRDDPQHVLRIRLKPLEAVVVRPE